MICKLFINKNNFLYNFGALLDNNYIVEKLSYISEKIGSIDTKIEYLITDINKFKEYVKTIEYDLKKIVSEIDGLKKYDKFQDDKIELLQYQVSDIEDRLYKLSRYIDKFSHRDKIKLKIYLKIRNILNSRLFKYVLTTLFTAVFFTFVVILIELFISYLGIEVHYISLFKEYLK